MTDTRAELPRRWHNDVASHAAIGFAVVWSITATAIVGSDILARHAADALEHTLIGYADDLAHASQAQLAAERMIAVGRGYLLTDAPDFLVHVRDAERQLDTALQALDRGEAIPAEGALLRAVSRSAARYHQLLGEAVEPKPTAEERREMANTLREKLLPAREDLASTLGTLVAHRQGLQVAARREATRLAVRSVKVTFGLGALALGLSILLAWLFTRRLAQIYRLERAGARQVALALAAKEELLGIVAHDLRNPLSAILIRATSIAKGDRCQNAVKQAQSIRSTCQRMAGLIQGLLDAASIEAGRMSIAPDCWPVEAILTDVLETFAPAASEKRISLERDVRPRDLVVWADRERLHQALSNLVGNALKFTSEAGAVRISAGIVEGRVRFSVIDTGPGIVPEHLPHLFERYWKSDRQGARGAGLGLYIAKGIVEAHQGQIWVDSTPGKGSAFRFELSLPGRRNERRLSVETAPRTPIPPTARSTHVEHLVDR